jgi:hypothetical protein
MNLKKEKTFKEWNWEKEKLEKNIKLRTFRECEIWYISKTCFSFKKI